MKPLLHLIREYWIWSSLFLCVCITFLSLTPLAQLPGQFGGDKLHHFVAYGVLVLPLMLKKPTYWLLILCSYALLSGAIELIQPNVNRHGDWFDLIANMGGLICGAFVAYLINYCSPPD